MTELERAVEALKAAAKQSGVSKHLPDVVSQFASYLVILVSDQRFNLLENGW
jgi:hypothetical protein